MKGRQGKGRGAENRNTLHRSIRRTMALCVAVCGMKGEISTADTRRLSAKL